MDTPIQNDTGRRSYSRCDFCGASVTFAVVYISPGGPFTTHEGLDGAGSNYVATWCREHKQGQSIPQGKLVQLSDDALSTVMDSNLYDEDTRNAAEEELELRTIDYADASAGGNPS